MTRAPDMAEDQMYALGLLEEEAAARITRRLQQEGPAGWEALERHLASEERVREALASSGVSLRGDTLALLGQLQAIRNRLHLLRSIAGTTASIGRRSTDATSSDTGGGT